MPAFSLFNLKKTHKGLLYLSAVLLINGCALQSDQPNRTSKLSAQLTNMQTQQSERFKEMEQQLEQLNTLSAQREQACLQEFDQIKSNQQTLLAHHEEKVNQLAAIEQTNNCPSAVNALDHDKFVIGEIEYMHLNAEGISLDARVDTGAETSSLGVFDLTYFERDGAQWLKFKLDESEQGKFFEYPIERRVKIRQQGRVQASVRPVIEMSFSLGDQDFRGEFSLADRKHLQYQGLLGRSFLIDIAIVDVSKKYALTSPASEQQ